MKLKNISLRLKSTLARYFIIAVMAIFLVTAFSAIAFARGVVYNAPPPNSQRMGESSRIGIEGLQTIVDNGNLNINSNVKITNARPSTAIGRGDLVEIVQVAADIWKTALPELPNFNIVVGWSDFELDANRYLESSSISTDGIFTDLAALYIHGDENFPVAQQKISDTKDVDGIILFNSQENLELRNGGRVWYYLDPDPTRSIIFGELDRFAEREKNYVNYGRSKFVEDELFNEILGMGEITENDLVIDVFSVALHEIQHALGLTKVNRQATGKLTETKNTNITNFSNTLDLPVLWAEFPTSYSTGVKQEYTSLHLNDDLSLSDRFNFSRLVQNPRDRVGQIKTNRIPTPVALDIVTDRERKCLSAADVLAVAAINNYDYRKIDLDPCRTIAEMNSSRSIPRQNRIEDFRPGFEIDRNRFDVDRANPKK